MVYETPEQDKDNVLQVGKCSILCKCNHWFCFEVRSFVLTLTITLIVIAILTLILTLTLTLTKATKVRSS